METKNIGLRNIEVADTKICAIDGINGKLIYRGYDILDLVKKSNFEETACLLLNDDLPTDNVLADFAKRLVEAREVPENIEKNLENLPKTANPMDVIQSRVSELAAYDKEKGDSRETNYNRAIDLISKIPIIIAYWDRIRNGKDVIPPSKKLDHAGNFLYMLTGKEPDSEIARIFDICLILHAEHSFNASTFAAREVASTRAHIYAAVSAAIGALSGELHGGANFQVMKMLLGIQTEDKVEPWIKEKLAKGERVMGMGHAVYKTFDPRAEVLRELSRRLSEKTGQPWYKITKKVEDVTEEEMKKIKGSDIFPNVDLYSASAYYMLGIPMDLNTPIFAISRVAGWTAHVIEEKFAEAQPKPMLYRPKAVYVGKYCGPSGCEYVPIEKRLASI
ncbi:MAG: citrate (Si)-synthase [Thaumarchaeota archaeon]|nr:citrate (Si)-synthase [Nitrososphaerota archaeon]MDE1866236.1 citrate (Si)-synthase [Nitrososphaerota archaeon]